MNGIAIYSSKFPGSYSVNREASTVLSCAATTLGIGFYIVMEKAMRRIVLATAATLTLLAAGSFAPNRAEAMTVTTPTGHCCLRWKAATWPRTSPMSAAGSAVRTVRLRLAPRLLPWNGVTAPTITAAVPLLWTPVLSPPLLVVT